MSEGENDTRLYFAAYGLPDSQKVATVNRLDLWWVGFILIKGKDDTAK